jgi:hypothetical protein
MSLPNSVYLRLKNEIENAQFNTMLCKGKMNFALEKEKENGGIAKAAPATMPGACWGRAPGKIALLYHTDGCCWTKKQLPAVLRTARGFVTWRRRLS